MLRLPFRVNLNGSSSRGGEFSIIDTYLTVYFIYSTLYRFIMCILFDFWLLQKAKMDFFFLQLSYYLVQDKGRDNGMRQTRENKNSSGECSWVSITVILSVLYLS